MFLSIGLSVICIITYMLCFNSAPGCGLREVVKSHVLQGKPLSPSKWPPAGTWRLSKSCLRPLSIKIRKSWVDPGCFARTSRNVLVYWWRNYFDMCPVSSTDHTGHACNCQKVGFDPVWLLIVQRKPDKLLYDTWSRVVCSVSDRVLVPVL